jgi:hypothetical protein
MGAEPPNGESGRLAANLATAQWMADYDRVAWESTDLLTKEDKDALRKVSTVWFCAKAKGTWYAFYGEDTDHGYQTAFCYAEDSGRVCHRVPPPLLPDRDRFAQAITRTLAPVQELTRQTTVRFNYYVRSEGDRVAVYYTPGLQPDGKLAYGIERTEWVDGASGKVVSEWVHGQVLRGIVPGRDRKLVLDLGDCAVPSPQAIFTMLANRETFGAIVARCQGGDFGLKTLDGKIACVPVPAPSAL